MPAERAALLYTVHLFPLFDFAVADSTRNHFSVIYHQFSSYPYLGCGISFRVAVSHGALGLACMRENSVNFRLHALFRDLENHN